MDRQTVAALLTDAALERLPQDNLRFCSDADCDVVYFDGFGALFPTADLRVPVWQKQPFGDRVICYCFGDSESSIRAEVEFAGVSEAAERIRAHIAAGRCACEVRNPRGTCCLGDIVAAVERQSSSSK